MMSRCLIHNIDLGTAGMCWECDRMECIRLGAEVQRYARRIQAGENVSQNITLHVSVPAGQAKDKT